MGSEKILVVDDDLMIRSLLAEVLSEVGFEVQTVATADEARHHLVNDDYALALVDRVLPGMDGYTFIRSMRTWAASTWVIAMTGHATRASSEELLQLGVHGFLEKPFELDQLTRRVREVIEARWWQKLLDGVPLKLRDFVAEPVRIHLFAEDPHRAQWLFEATRNHLDEVLIAASAHEALAQLRTRPGEMLIVDAEHNERLLLMLLRDGRRLAPHLGLLVIQDQPSQEMYNLLLDSQGGPILPRSADMATYRKRVGVALLRLRRNLAAAATLADARSVPAAQSSMP